MSEKRAVCLNCMDGRVQIPVIAWIMQDRGFDFVDMITEAGMDGFLSKEANNIEDVKRKINISIEKNNASMVFIVGHFDCKGNPVDESTHKDEIRFSVGRLKNEFDNIVVAGLWVNQNWHVEEV